MWTSRVNKVLGKAGYALSPVAQFPESPAEVGSGSADTAGLDANASTQQSGRRTWTARSLPSHYDEAAVHTIMQVRPRTMTGHWKLFGLILATRYIQAHDIPGDIVECGVWRGGSMQAVALTLLERREQERALHLFDTFEGMPPPTEHDSSGGVSAQALLDEASRDEHVWAVAGLDDVRTGMAQTGYPSTLIHFHVGRVEETVPGQAPDRIAILRLDTDWYESTRHELEHLYDRLSPGGVLILDDYGDWDGARKATDEWLAKTRTRLLLLPIHGGRIAVKPG